jgi:hypothetical protein
VFLACSAHAQEPSKVHAVGACNPKTIQSTIHLFALQDTAPNFELFLFCQAGDWKEFLIHFKMQTNVIAFTDWTHGRIYLGPKNLESPVELRETIKHKLEHLRCACLLGEKPY